MSIKHSKYRNTAILFELLVRQTTADLIQNKDPRSVKIIKKYFKGTDLGREHALYSQLNYTNGLSEVKANIVISSVLEQRKKLDQSNLNRLKYNLIKEIKSNYDIDNFFKAKIDNYKIYASIYTLFESQISKESDANQITSNKLTLLEHLSYNKTDNDSQVNLVDEFMKEDKEIRLMAYKIMVNKFNDKYSSLSERQKSVLKEYINNISETEHLKTYLNETISTIVKELKVAYRNVKDPVTKIKLAETIRLIKPIPSTGFVKDEHLASTLQFIELVEELNGTK
jgi:hypothetical protein